MIPQPPDDKPVRRVLDRPAFLERIQEEIARCLRTRRHLSVVLLLIERIGEEALMQGPTLGPDALARVEGELASHIRRYDLVAVSGAAEVLLLFPEATRENADVILARIRAATVAFPRSMQGSCRLWGLATWPTDGGDPAALLETARRRLSAT